MRKLPLLFWCLGAAQFGLPLPARAALDLWVAPHGSDSEMGSRERPLATLAGARDRVRNLARAGSGDDIVVYFRSGTYRVDETVIFSLEDSRSSIHSITLASAPGERAAFHGGPALAGRWEQVEKTLWMLRIPEVASGRWYFHQLYRGGMTLSRARAPKEGFYTVKTVDEGRRTLTLNETLPAEWSGLTGVELDSTAWWHFNRQNVAAIGANTVTAFDPIGTDTSSRRIRPDSHSRIWLENALVFADRPGEWFLDRIQGVLYYRSAEGEDPNRETFIAPIVRELIVLKGEEGAPLRNMHLVNLEFAYTDWALPPYGRLGVQAGAWASDRSRTFSPPAAVRWIRAENCTISNCSFHDLGEGAVSFEIGCHHDRVETSAFERIGTDVVQVGRIPEYTGISHPLHWDFQNPVEAPSDIDIIDNAIKESGTVDYGSVGIWVGYAHHIRVLHNLVSGSPYSGMSIGWRWAPGLTNCHDNEIAWNRVEKVLQQTGDGGGIYLVGDQPGTVVHDNYVHDAGRNYWAHGLYADEDSDHMEFARNYVTTVMNYSIFMNLNGSHQNLHDNNGERGPTVIVESSHYAEALRRTAVIRSVTFSPARIPPDPDAYGPRSKATHEPTSGQ